MSLKSKVVTGVGWVASANLFGQIITWSITVFVMRLLSPADYGLLAMASVFVAFLAMMAAAGLGPAIVQAISIDDEKLRQLLGLITALNLILCMLLFAAAPLIAGFFNEPRLVDVVRVLALQFVITGFAVIPESMLGRALRVKARALVDLASNLTGGATTWTLAWAGYGVWSLVKGAMVTDSGKTIGQNIAPLVVAGPFLDVRALDAVKVNKNFNLIVARILDKRFEFLSQVGRTLRILLKPLAQFLSGRALLVCPISK
jgi:teichuronic acid exporter